MKKLSVIAAALVLFAGVSFASPVKHVRQEKAKTEKKVAKKEKKVATKEKKVAKEEKKADKK